MKTKNPLRLALEDVLGPAGFTRKGDSWYRRSEEIVEVVNLQKSQWGAQFYLNYGIWLRALGEEPFRGTSDAISTCVQRSSSLQKNRLPVS